MEDYKSELPNLPNETEMVAYSNDENTSVVAAETKPDEHKETVENVEDIVSSTTGSGDQEDGPKVASEDKSLDEKPPSVSAKPKSQVILCLEEHEVDQRVIDLIYWKDVKKTAVVFGTLLLIMLFLVYHTLLSVVSFFALSVLTVSMLYRIGMTVIGAVQKTGSGSPYKSLLEKDRAISKERARDIGEMLGAHLNTIVIKLTKLFLVEDIFTSLKFGIFLWVMSCVGKWFHAITLLIAGTLFVFSIPKLYEEHQVQVDKFLCQARMKSHDIVQKVKTKVESRFKKKDKSA